MGDCPQNEITSSPLRPRINTILNVCHANEEAKKTGEDSLGGKSDPPLPSTFVQCADIQGATIHNIPICRTNTRRKSELATASFKRHLTINQIEVVTQLAFR